MIYIRVDANEQIATGHLMRTLSIAEAIKIAGGDCCFICSDNQCDDKIKNNGFEVICLNSAWDNLNSEIEKMVELILSRNIKCLLVDSYYVTPEYLDTLSGLTQIVYLDDLKAFEYSCSAIINYVIGENGQDYSYFLGKLYTGPRYVPLRKEFSIPVDGTVRQDIQEVMVTTGGADRYHFGIQFLERFLSDERFGTCRIRLVVGSKSVDKEYLLTTYEREKRVTILADVDNMSFHMREADCIVSAGGTTLYEACACKTPTISYSLADNQLTNVKQFQQLGKLYYAGDIRDDIKVVLENILEQLQRMKSVTVRKEISESMGAVVDGKGASRIAQILIHMEKQSDEVNS